MNVFSAIGRLTKDPVVRYTQGENSTAIARYTLAIDRPGTKQAQTADFIPCVTFGRQAEFVEKYLHKGQRIAVTGSVVSGSYQNKEGKTVYTVEVRVDRHEFCDSKNSGSGSGSASAQPANGAASTYADPSGFAEGFMAIPDGIDDEALPFV